MIWVAWRIQRFTILGAVAAALAFAIWMIIHGAHEHAVWASLSAHGCLTYGPNGLIGGAACDGLRPYDFTHWNTYFEAGLYAIPGAVGVLLGAPLIAQEIERGTSRLAWAQSITRARWLTIKLGLGALVTVGISGALIAVGDWWIGAVHSGGHILPANFDITGIVPIAYGLFAFMLGSALGAFLRRTIWAVFLGLILFGLFRAWVRIDVRSHLAALHNSIGHPSFGLTAQVRNAWVINSGYVRLGRVDPSPGSTWHGGTSRFFLCVTRLLSNHNSEGGSATRIPSSDDRRCQAITKLHQVTQYQPASHFWVLQILEGAIFLGAAVVLLGIVVILVRRKL
jgi:hypothetical protein